MKKLILKWFLRGVLSVVVFTVLSMMWEVLTLGNFHDARTYVSFSPDGRYKMDHILPANGGPSVQMVTSLETGAVVVVEQVPSVEVVSINPCWFCFHQGSDNVYRLGDCYAYQLEAGDSDIPELTFPPSLWQSMRTELFLKLTGSQNYNLEIVKVDPNYPPVSKFGR